VLFRSNRIDEVVVFEPLGREQIAGIAEIQLQRLRSRLAERELMLELSPEALDKLVAIGYDPVYGARPLKRAIQRWIENPLAQQIPAGQVLPGATIQARSEGDGIVVGRSGRLDSTAAAGMGFEPSSGEAGGLRRVLFVRVVQRVPFDRCGPERAAAGWSGHYVSRDLLGWCLEMAEQALEGGRLIFGHVNDVIARPAVLAVRPRAAPQAVGRKDDALDADQWLGRLEATLDNLIRFQRAFAEQHETVQRQICQASQAHSGVPLEQFQLQLGSLA